MPDRPMPDRQHRPRRDPNALWLGEQAADGGGGPLMAVHRLVRWLMTRERRRG